MLVFVNCLFWYFFPLKDFFKIGTWLRSRAIDGRRKDRFLREVHISKIQYFNFGMMIIFAYYVADCGQLGVVAGTITVETINVGAAQLGGPAYIIIHLR